jgi:hypothetical protein
LESDRRDPVGLRIDTRLIEAEAVGRHFRDGGALIASAPRSGARLVPAGGDDRVAGADPATAATAVLREKAFWTFGRGQRLGDLRRMIRQYNGAASAFPSGSFLKGGTYGTDVNFPVPDVERVNPQFAGCIDRNA